MNKWPTDTLDDVCDLVVDCPHSTPKWTDHGHLVIRNQNIRNGRLDLANKSYTDEKHYLHRIRRAKPRTHDIIFTREAPMGEVCLVPEGLECCVGQRQVLLRAGKDIDPVYLFYTLQSPYVRHQILWNEGTGSTVSNVRIPILKQLKIPRQPNESSIAAILKAIDDKIDLNQRMNETLEAMARALFKSWFVDFDPVRAKAEGRKPEGMDAATAALFPAAFNDDGLPEGWDASEIGREATVCGGSTPSTKEPAFWDGDINWTSPKDLSSLSHPVLIDTERKITQAGLEKISSGLLPLGTVLLSSRAPIGYIAITEIPVAINQGYIALIPDKRLPNIYLWLWLIENMEEIKSRANGSTFQEISKSNFRPIPVVVPRKEILVLFENTVGPLYRLLVNNVQQSKTLSTIRDALLPKLISGELRIDDAVPVRKEAAG